jgi:3-oxoadipate enol-lactonase
VYTVADFACAELGVPHGRSVALAGRGTTWVREMPGPAGARPVVLLHGLAATGGLNWAGTFHALAKRYRVVSVDHRGHGRGIRTGHFNLEDCADDAAALIEELGLEDPLLVGYSMGGPIATLVWKRHPGLVAGLVLCATSRNFRGSPGEKLAFAALATAGLSPVLFPERLARQFASLFCALPIPGLGKQVKWAVDELAGHEPRAILQAAGAIGRFNAGSWIDAINIPTAVLVHTQDQVVPLKRQLRLAESIGGARVYEVPGGHAAVAGGTEREAFVTTLRQACDDTSKACGRTTRRQLGIKSKCAS